MYFLKLTRKFSNLPRKFTRTLSDSVVKRKIETGDKVLVVRKVTEDDVMNFAKLTDDYNPIHVSAERKVVHGALLNGFLSGVLGTKLPGPGTIVVHQSLHYPKPCYAGDTIEITVTVLSARKIIKCGYKLVADDDRIVLEGEGTFITSKII